MIVCVKCGRQMRPKKNGVDVKDLARHPAKDGKPEEFWPYKVWQGDILECQDCGTEVIYIDDRRQQPLREHYQPGFHKFVEGAYPAKEWTR